MHNVTTTESVHFVSVGLLDFLVNTYESVCVCDGFYMISTVSGRIKITRYRPIFKVVLLITKKKIWLGFLLITINNT